jgi:hypothetical protein
MKKHTLSIIGIATQCFGIGFMFYGLNNNRVWLWTGFAVIFFGLALINVGIFRNNAKNK